MSKETTAGTPCPGCDQRIAFPGYHIKHCTGLLTKRLKPAHVMAFVAGAAETSPGKYGGARG